MFRTLLTSIVVVGVVSTTFTSSHTANSLAAVSKHAVQSTAPAAKSPYKGDYAGPFSAKSSFVGLQVGKITLIVKEDGSAEGTVDNQTSGSKGTLRGKVKDDGSITLDCEYPTTTTIVKGTVKKTEDGHLKGELTQYREATVLASIEIDLRAK
jgi:hypothetical protein